MLHRSVCVRLLGRVRYRFHLAAAFEGVNDKMGVGLPSFFSRNDRAGTQAQMTRGLALNLCDNAIRNT